MIVRSLPPGRERDAERLWVTITVIDGDRIAGNLANEPLDTPQPRYGASIVFDRGAVIDVEWAEDRTVRPPSAPQRRWYWERCLVDRCVTEEGVPVGYLCREEPDLTDEGDAAGVSVATSETSTMRRWTIAPPNLSRWSGC